jgi:predicted PurR-regulated permease PerM
MDQDLQQLLFNFGGLGVLALIAWYLVKSLVRQLENFGETLKNHLREDTEQQRKIAESLSSILEILREGERKKEKEK